MAFLLEESNCIKEVVFFVVGASSAKSELVTLIRHVRGHVRVYGSVDKKLVPVADGHFLPQLQVPVIAKRFVSVLPLLYCI